MKNFKKIVVCFFAAVVFGVFEFALAFVLRNMVISINPDPSFIVAYDAGRMAVVFSILLFLCISFLYLLLSIHLCADF